MNDRIKNKEVTGQKIHQTADLKVNATVFLPNALFKTILANHTIGTFSFAQHVSRPFAKPKEPIISTGICGNYGHIKT